MSSCYEEETLKAWKGLFVRGEAGGGWEEIDTKANEIYILIYFLCITEIQLSAHAEICFPNFPRLISVK